MPEDFARIPKPAPDAESAIRLRMNDWIAAVNGGDAASINALYAGDAVLLGTFDPVLRTTPDQRREYFVNFKSRRKLKAVLDRCDAIALDENAGVANGLYTFSFVDNNGAPQTVKARFTFVLAFEIDEWLIVTHHSSVEPPPPSAIR